MVWKSSNYALYGDMSRRMFEVLQDFVPSVEPYSIDKMLLDFAGMQGDPSYSNQATVSLEPSADSFTLIATTVKVAQGQ